jgi:hypothetical protein
MGIRRSISILLAVLGIWSAAFYASWRIVTAEEQTQQRPPMFVLQIGIGKYLDAPTWTDLRGR